MSEIANPKDSTIDVILEKRLMSLEFLEAREKVDRLSPEEKLRLISYLVQQLSHCEIKPKPRRKLTDFIGIAPKHLGGMDATEYIRRMRRGEFPELELKKEGERQAIAHHNRSSL